MISWQRNLIISTITLCLFTPLFVHATGYIELVGVPRIGVDTGPIESTQDYINVLLNLSIGLAAFIAVVKLVLAGVKYALSEIVTDKGDAKEDIKSAIIGLLIIIGSVTILNEINPKLSVLSFVDDIETPVLPPGSGPGEKDTRTKTEKINAACAAARAAGDSDSCSINVCDPKDGRNRCSTSKGECTRDGGRPETDLTVTPPKIYCFKEK